MKKPSALLHFFFACLLLITQQVVLAHGYAHTQPTPQSVAQTESLAGESLCDECLACAALGAAPGSALAPLGLEDFRQFVLPTAETTPFVAIFTRLFDSRAPPFLFA